MFDDLSKIIPALRASGEAFATATVVRCEPPSSGKPGDKAIIQTNGKMLGWVGGECTQGIVVEEAKQVIEKGQPRLIRISPTPDSKGQQGVIEHNMSCHSGGTLDIYIEPTLPAPRLIIIGRSPVGQALAKLGKVIDYHVTVIAPGMDKENYPQVDDFYTKVDLSETLITQQTYIVLTTQGEYDEEALEEALKTKSPYIAFIASRKKADAVFNYLSEKGVSAGKIQQVKTPAGLDIKARLPEEIAVSILAEIIQVRRTETKDFIETQKEKLKTEPLQEAQDPICGMSVTIDSAAHITEYHGKNYYFCCGGCKRKFNQNPETFVISDEIF